MIGIIVQLAVSWLLIWLFEKKDLGVLGFFPTKQRIADFFLFLVITATCCALGFLLRIVFGHESWKLNPVLTINLIASGLWWNIKSVLFEELIFRGVIFYILIKRLGPVNAIIISAVAFGIYHWFSFGIIGDVRAMLITFVLTGTMGLLYAYGYAKTFSLYIPCAIHLGWNFTQNFVFSSGPIGNGIFIKPAPGSFRTDSFILYLIVFLLPVTCAILINFLLLRRRRQVELDT